MAADDEPPSPAVAAAVVTTATRSDARRKKEVRRSSSRRAVMTALLLASLALWSPATGTKVEKSSPWHYDDALETAAMPSNKSDADSPSARRPRQADQSLSPAEQLKSRVITVRLMKVSKDVNYAEQDGHIQALKGENIHLRVYGIGLTKDSRIKMTTYDGKLGEPCGGSEKSGAQSKTFGFRYIAEDGTWGDVVIYGDKVYTLKGHTVEFFCLSDGEGLPFVHQGSDGQALIEITEMLLPLWLMIICIAILLCLSGLFSGLNLGLMALDQTELKIVQSTGTPSEKSYANKIAPIRKHGNFLLCSLLLGNVLVNNTLTILLDILTSGLVAIIGATMGIVIFGEIIPQAICSRHGLAVGAYTIWITKFFMLLTAPLSFPISKILDKVLGAEIGTVYDKKKLIELLRVTNADHDLEKEEVDIVTGALVYKDKTVKDVMTALEDVYMLPLDSVLDFDTVSEIREQGYSRIPVYSNEYKNIVHILFAKDLMFVDPDDQMPLSTVCEFYSNDVNFVFQDTPLNVMFNDFKSGDKGHMAFVQEINTQGDGDPFYETIGLVTLEDIIEEIIQQEIVDETDVVADNRTKRRLKRIGRQGLEGKILGAPEEQKRKVNVSPQLTLAVFQYLTTSIEPLKHPVMSDSILKKMLALDVFREVKLKKDKNKVNEKELIIVEKGKSIDFFVLIIEGRVEVNIGREELKFEAGPFNYFGVQVLNTVMEMHYSGGVKLSPAIPAHVEQEATGGGGGGGFRASFRKGSGSPNALELHPVSSMSKRNSSAHAHGGDHGKHGGMSLFPNTPPHPPFVPDYTVRAVTDVLYLRIKKGTYAAAVKASQMPKHKQQAEIGDIHHFLQKVNEHDGDMDHFVHGSAAGSPSSPLARSPSVKSPDKERGVAAMATAAIAATLELGGVTSSPSGSSPGSKLGSPRLPLRSPSAKKKKKDISDGNSIRDSEFSALASPLAASPSASVPPAASVTAPTPDDNVPTADLLGNSDNSAFSDRTSVQTAAAAPDAGAGGGDHGGGGQDD